MKTGLSDDEMARIRAALEAVPAVEKAVLFGSRAMGLARSNSDVDILLYGSALQTRDVLRAASLLDATTLPYQFDLIRHDANNASLLEHVREYGKVIFQRQEMAARSKPSRKTEGMASEYPLIPLGAVAKVRSGYAFKSHEMGDEGYPIIKIKNITPPTVDTISCERVSEKVISQIPDADRYAIANGDILIAMTGATVGKIGRFPQAYDRFYLNQRVGKVYLTLPSKADYSYLYYALSQNTYIHQMLGVADGSAQANISGTQIECLEVPLPSLRKQRAIARILGTLDDKLELNRRMNETLEAMARALFKAWFVDFEPVRAKMTGRWRRGQSLPGLPAHLYDLFPDRLVESELGEIPEGWEIGTIENCCSNIFNGGTPKRAEESFWNGGTIPWLTSGEVRQSIVTTTENYITEKGLDNSSTKWVFPMSTLVALYGATAGQITLTSISLTTKQAVCALVPKNRHVYFNYLWMKNIAVELENRAIGSAQQNISKEIVQKTPVLLVSQGVLDSFNAVMQPIFDKCISCLFQSNSLSQLRDAMLPMLLTGKIEMSHA